MVYVLDKDGQPLMPTDRHGKVRRLLTRREQEIPHFYKWWDELR